MCNRTTKEYAAESGGRGGRITSVMRETKTRRKIRELVGLVLFVFFSSKI